MANEPVYECSICADEVGASEVSKHTAMHRDQSDWPGEMSWKLVGEREAQEEPIEDDGVTGDPPDLETYTERFERATRIQGYGADTTTVMPCPFCAAPGWLGMPITDFEQTKLEAGATCKKCGRSARGKFTRSPEGVSIEMVQTGGPDPAAYLPHMDREETTATGRVLTDEDFERLADEAQEGHPDLVEDGT